MICKCKGCCAVSCTAGALVVIGGLNWGLNGLGMLMHTNLNVVNLIVGQWPTVEAIVYLLVGIATIAVLIGCKCEKCKGMTCGPAMDKPMAKDGAADAAKKM